MKNINCIILFKKLSFIALFASVLSLPQASLMIAAARSSSCVAQLFSGATKTKTRTAVSVVTVCCVALGAYRLLCVYQKSTKEKLPIIYRQATSGDVQGIVDLINTQAYKDSDKIVIVPEAFRVGYVENGIRERRFFVAVDGKRIIGYKKLFCMIDRQESEVILGNELRLRGTKPKIAGSISIDDQVSLSSARAEIPELFSVPVTSVYTGADYVHPDYRGKCINSDLTKYALDAVLPTVIEHIQGNKSRFIALVYGLTHSNAGEGDNLLGGRTGGIVKAFGPFAQRVAVASNCISPSLVHLSRHDAFKPSFDPKADACRPLSDDKSIPGYGCLIACPLVLKMS